MLDNSEQMQRLGERVAEILHLKKDAEGHYRTDHGKCNDLGLGRLISEIVNKNQERADR